MNWMAYANINFINNQSANNLQFNVKFVKEQNTDKRGACKTLPYTSKPIAYEYIAIDDVVMTLYNSNELLSPAPVGDDSNYMRERLHTMLHELGHILGLSHEMQNPNCPLHFNEDLLEYKDQYTKLDPNNSFSPTAFDQESVMMYDISKYDNYENVTVKDVSSHYLSALDKEYIGKLYPFNGTVRLWHFIKNGKDQIFSTGNARTINSHGKNYNIEGPRFYALPD